MQLIDKLRVEGSLLDLALMIQKCRPQYGISLTEIRRIECEKERKFKKTLFQGVLVKG